MDWEAFKTEFWRDFCPTHSDAAAINKLESTSYFQKSCSMDDYMDEFIDLITDVGYTDPKTIMVKFRRRLDPQIQNAIATMTYGRPSDISLTHWYDTAKNIDQNWAANEAFRSA